MEQLEEEPVGVSGEGQPARRPTCDVSTFSMTDSRAALVTEEELRALPETADRIELLDGEVIDSPSPLVRHHSSVTTRLASGAAARVVHRRRLWPEKHPRAFVGRAPLDVRFGQDHQGVAVARGRGLIRSRQDPPAASGHHESR
jgi:hypothetical protein